MFHIGIIVSTRVTQSSSSYKMSESRDQDQGKDNLTEITTFPVPFTLKEINAFDKA